MVDCSEPNYRTDVQLQALLARRDPLRPQGWFRRLLDLLRSF
jgi:hypothetical protein